MNFKPTKIKILISIAGPLFIWVDVFSVPLFFFLISGFNPIFFFLGVERCSDLIGLPASECSLAGTGFYAFVQLPLFCFSLMVLIYVLWSLLQNKNINKKIK